MGNLTKEEFVEKLTKAMDEKREREVMEQLKRDRELGGYIADLIRDKVKCKRDISMKNPYSNV